MNFGDLRPARQGMAEPPWRGPNEEGAILMDNWKKTTSDELIKDPMLEMEDAKCSFSNWHFVMMPGPYPSPWPRHSASTPLSQEQCLLAYLVQTTSFPSAGFIAKQRIIRI